MIQGAVTWGERGEWILHRVRRPVCMRVWNVRVPLNTPPLTRQNGGKKVGGKPNNNAGKVNKQMWTR